jgi:hypothetical protein
MLALVLAALAAAQSGPPAPVPREAPLSSEATAEGFAQSCAEIRALVHARKWKLVRDRWLSTLELHREKAYVRPRRAVIEDDVRQAAVRQTFAGVDLEALGAGLREYVRLN